MASDDDSIASRLSAFRDLCRRHGFRVTPQRQEVLRQVLRRGDHPDADVIHAAMQASMPGVSLDTVYRTLRFLEERGQIQRLSRLHGSARFDANVGRHHHFVCTVCGRVADFASAEFDRWQTPPEVAALGTVESFHAELHGVCHACRSQPRGGKHSSAGGT